MFGSAELGHAIIKQTYARQVPKLREALLDAQYDLFQDGRFPVLILIGGVDGAGEEIVRFEKTLADEGALMMKFWFHLSKDRQKTAFKRFKITPEDWRNRRKWDAYERAVCDMVDRTSTDIAPWTLVEANDKLHARAKVLRTICDRMEAALERRP